MQSKRQELIKLWESLPEAYQDTVAVDAQRIVDSVFDQILGPAASSPQVESAHGRTRTVGPGEDGDDVNQA